MVWASIRWSENSAIYSIKHRLMWHMDNIDIIFSFYFFTWCICTIISYIYSCVCCIDPGALLATWLRLTWPSQVEHKIKCIICWYTEYILGREEGKQTWCNNNKSWSRDLKWSMNRLHDIPMSDEASNTSCVTSHTQTGVCVGSLNASACS